MFFILSLEPFSDDLTVSSPDKFIKFNGQNYITTTNRQGKISFKMPCDGVVYMKAVPHFETGSYNGLNDWWDLSIDISGSKSKWQLTSS